jgi:transcriptional regulator with XRE-family HTH domain
MAKRTAFKDLAREKLTDLRRKRNISKNALAKKAGINPSMLTLIEGGLDPTLDLRMRLAIAIASANDESPTILAQEFFRATPHRDVPSDWEKKFSKLQLRLFQTEITEVRCGLPLFFDTAPFLVAERRGYYREIKLDVRFDYVKWPLALAYLPTAATDNNLQITIYNRASIGEEMRRNQRMDAVFCWPLSIYEPSGFAFLIRRPTGGYTSAGPWETRVREFSAKHENGPKIVVAGTDMKSGALQMLRKACPELDAASVEDWFVVLDQFDALEVFLAGLGDAFVGGVPQRIKAAKRRDENVVLATGEDIGLSKQFNGVVCAREAAAREAARGAIAQVLWGWYRAVKYVDRHYSEEAKFITDSMNVYAGRFKYDPREFVDFWEKTSDFAFAKTPADMLRRIEETPDYVHRVYDSTNDFAAILKKLDPFIPE